MLMKQSLTYLTDLIRGLIRFRIGFSQKIITTKGDCSHTKKRRHLRGEVDSNSVETSRGGHRVESPLVASK
ncbi:hypothetical protein Gotur_024422 [Gossypium turneri]